MFTKEEMQVIGDLLLEADIKGRQSGVVATIINKLIGELKALDRPPAPETKEDE
jgi:hypothetical protein